MASSVANKVPSGVQWLKLPPNWLVVAAKVDFGGKKISKCLKFSSRHLHQAISAKCPPSGTKCRKHSAHWNPLECNGARQVAPMRFCATWRHYAPNNAHRGGQSAPKRSNLIVARAKRHLNGDYFAPNTTWFAPFGAICRLKKSLTASHDFLVQL